MTVPLLRTSERSDFKRCPWLWEQTWLKGLRGRREPTWAWFGTAIHRALEARYPVGDKRGDPADVHDAFDEALDGQTGRIYAEGLEVDETEIVDARTLGHQMLSGYIEEWGSDSHWTVLHTEQPFQIDVPHPDDPSKVIVVYAGTWDLCIWDKNEKVYKIVDHKTRKSFPALWKFYSINDQAGSYLWVAREVLIHKGILGKDDVIEGLIFNALKKQPPDTRPINPRTGQACNSPKKADYTEALLSAGKWSTVPRGTTVEDLKTACEAYGLKVYGEPSVRQPTPRYHREEVWRSPSERVTQARRVQAEAVIMNGMRNGTLPIYKVPTEDCNRCPVFEYCELNEQDPEAAEEFAGATLAYRDPYRDHREAMAGGGIIL